ncbi:hypothetical protein SOVF_105950, partial [Spinacia oleracea]
SSSPDLRNLGISQAARDVDSSSPIKGVDMQLLCRNTDVEGMRLYLNEHLKEHNKSPYKILDALKCAPDPGKLVLDVFQSFHLRFPDKYQGVNNKISCINLLLELMKLSPPLTHEVKEEATNYSALKANLKENDFLMEKYGFLQFLATFKLAGFCDSNELFSMFKSFFNGYDVFRPEDNPSLCCALGLSKKIPGIYFTS